MIGPGSDKNSNKLFFYLKRSRRWNLMRKSTNFAIYFCGPVVWKNSFLWTMRIISPCANPKLYKGLQKVSLHQEQEIPNAIQSIHQERFIIQTLILALCCTVDCQSDFQNDQTIKIVQKSLGWHNWADDDEVGDEVMMLWRHFPTTLGLE